MANKKDFTRRTRQRRRAIDVLYEVDQRGRLSAGAIHKLAERRTSEHPTQTGLPGYSRTIVDGVADHLAHIDYAISSYAHGWSLDRMPVVDRAILRVAIWEILYAGDITPAVAIDEAVKIAKLISTDNSPGFINGLLDTIATVKPGLLAQETELSAVEDDYTPSFDDSDFASDVDFADEIYDDEEYDAALDDGSPLGEDVVDREEVAPESGEKPSEEEPAADEEEESEPEADAADAEPSEQDGPADEVSEDELLADYALRRGSADDDKDDHPTLFD
ncbi:transcription antitermination factor NusB [Bowdeniella nasicola]|uniref:Transcription antitermination protein NusB n=1 Tax=Bowdeniella nasicola TaxID=208480 RepID=A0A1Q5Q3A8_9ACTO|nr:transcription antitermination factor NusB [Bowdeniella nasicola]OKL54306.1 transcription antitermination factor NusB [Bowdeniella nasicola]